MAIFSEDINLRLKAVSLSFFFEFTVEYCNALCLASGHKLPKNTRRLQYIRVSIEYYFYVRHKTSVFVYK